MLVSNYTILSGKIYLLDNAPDYIDGNCHERGNHFLLFFLKSLEKDINPIMLKNTKIQLHGES